MDYEKIVLITRQTRLEGLIERFNTRGQAKFYIEHSGGDFGFYEREHETYHTALNALRTTLKPYAKLQEIERHFLPNFLFNENDLIVTIGIDGLVVNTAKYLNGQPVVAVNPDPAHIDGVLLPFNVATAPNAVKQVLKGQVNAKQITMAEAKLNDGQTLLAFNDFFIGARTHVSARYLINANGQEEHHSSSGILVSTGVGSTGWLSSMFNMANGLLNEFSDAQPKIPNPQLAWDTDKLIFVVREPFVSKTSGAQVVCGAITAASPLILKSEMPEGGVIFSDGIEADYLSFNAGSTASIGLAAQKTNLILP